LKCKRSPKYWVQKMDKTIPYEIPYRSPWWYPLCSKHLKKIIKKSKIEIIALKTERIRKIEVKISCARISDQKSRVNWSMFIDWEEIVTNLEIDKNWRNLELKITILICIKMK